MKFAIDVDGVLADFNPSFAKILNRIQPIKVDIYASDFPNCWDWFPAYGWRKETTARAWTEVQNCGYFWKLLPPYPTAYGDIVKLNNLREDGHSIYFITNRPGKTSKMETEQWLGERGMKYPTVIVNSKHEQKGELCKVLGIDWIIDDSTDVLLKIPEGTKTAMVRRAWNTNYNDYFNKTVDSVREALDGIV